MNDIPNIRRLVTETLLMYIALPLMCYLDWLPIPKILALLLVTAYCGYRLWQDPANARVLLGRPKERQISKSILLRSLAVTVILIALIGIIQPTQFFSLIKQRPVLWIVVMVLYPILSALPQEFIYRTYFFHQYAELISLKYGTVIVSALAFSFMHIVYDNWWAVILSFGAGLMLGITYERTESLFWVTVEHAIYGWLIFTLGMGNFFYEPFLR
ncbi:MAG: CPBP family intramembrane metalloprotease [Balneolaceae bacterium]|jgi:membrane protease YdiL (CAAX protease family)